jgi:hypothetical protein
MMNKIFSGFLFVMTSIAAWNLFQAHTVGMEQQKTFTAVMDLNRSILEQNKALADQNALLRQNVARK